MKWVEELNNSLDVNIISNKLSDSSYWFYDRESGSVRNKNNSFFAIKGLQVRIEEKLVLEQPTIIQDEIGYLGIICKEIDGVIYFLMQAKIEPGNINKIQISPTIQATKSNFTQQHGGKKPAYLDYFVNANSHTIVVDQIQSEQSSRFFCKRNRNIIIKVDAPIEVLKSHKWMTLGQLKQLMRYDNLVNMDTRTVLSCIPFSTLKYEGEDLSGYFTDKAFYRSIMEKNLSEELSTIYNYINNYKMFDETMNSIVPLHNLDRWEMKDDGIFCKEQYSFSVIYCDIEVESREVREWDQPLFKAEGIATFGLCTTIVDGVRKFLVCAKPEVGCFDKIELGPTIQLESVRENEESNIERKFFANYNQKENVLYDVILSEEGGRFYHEQNRNIIIDITMEQVGKLPEGYFWVTYSTLNIMTQFNNCLNIQLRNLLSLLEV